jgi:6-phospho-3-hexuloisomerase
MQDFQKLKSDVLKELEEVIGKIDESGITELVNLILASPKTFVMGAGRSMLVCKAFAKRLSHLKVCAHVVGETVTPPIGKDDLLIACSSSGETLTTLSISKLANQYGGKTASITSDADSTLCRISDMSILVPLPAEPSGSVLPMASLFEQALFIMGDCIAILIKERLGITEDEMRTHHANLE